MEIKPDIELISYLKNEIKNLDRAIKRANHKNQISNVDYYERLKDALEAGLNRLLNNNS